MKTSVIISIFIIYFFSGCNSRQLQKSRMTKATDNLSIKDSSLLSKRNAGIDFIASGNQPVDWTLEMNYDKTFVFNSNNGVSISCAPTKGMKKNELEIFNAKGVQGEMEITIFNDHCNSGSNDNKTTVFTNNTLFEGCGQHLYNELLNNRWLLQEIDDHYLDLGDFPNGAPEITIDLSKNKMFGFDGCNSIYTTISIHGDRIRFANITSTLKACDGVRTEKIKLNMLNDQLIEYRFRNNELVLYLIDDSRLIFKPVY